MSISLEGVQLRTIAMTPDQTVSWNLSDGPDGPVFASSNCPDNLITAAINFADGMPSTLPGLGLGRNGGNVFDFGGFALKVVASGHNASSSSVDTLRANVCLAEGLKRVAQPAANEFGIRFVYTAPDIHVAYLPEPRGGSAVDAVIIMQKATGKHPDDSRLDPPVYVDRRSHYRRALRECGLKLHFVELDDIEENMKLKKVPFEVAVQVTKYDIIATKPIPV